MGPCETATLFLARSVFSRSTVPLGMLLSVPFVMPPEPPIVIILLLAVLSARVLFVRSRVPPRFKMPPPGLRKPESVFAAIVVFVMTIVPRFTIPPPACIEPPLLWVIALSVMNTVPP
jgi:hypothetical protein